MRGDILYLYWLHNFLSTWWALWTQRDWHGSALKEIQPRSSCRISAHLSGKLWTLMEWLVLDIRLQMDFSGYSGWAFTRRVYITDTPRLKVGRGGMITKLICCFEHWNFLPLYFITNSYQLLAFFSVGFLYILLQKFIFSILIHNPKMLYKTCRT